MSKKNCINRNRIWRLGLLILLPCLSCCLYSCRNSGKGEKTLSESVISLNELEEEGMEETGMKMTFEISSASYAMVPE